MSDTYMPAVKAHQFCTGLHWYKKSENELSFPILVSLMNGN